MAGQVGHKGQGYQCPHELTLSLCISRFSALRWQSDSHCWTTLSCTCFSCLSILFACNTQRTPYTLTALSKLAASGKEKLPIQPSLWWPPSLPPGDCKSAGVPPVLLPSSVAGLDVAPCSPGPVDMPSASAAESTLQTVVQPVPASVGMGNKRLDGG